MSRPQNATVSAPESPASVRTGTRSSPGALGAQGGVGLTGKCKECRGDVWLADGAWIHDGLGYWVHLVIAFGVKRDQQASKDQFALVNGPSGGGA